MKLHWKEIGCQVSVLHVFLIFLFLEIMPGCAVINCKSGLQSHFSSQGIKLYQFPRDPDMRQKWLAACGRKEDIKLCKGNVQLQIQYNM